MKHVALIVIASGAGTMMAGGFLGEDILTMLGVVAFVGGLVVMDSEIKRDAKALDS